MIEVKEMGPKDVRLLLLKVGYGHLGCARNGRPYVIPIHYAYDERDIFIFTTEGMKTEYIEENPEVCLQVEEVQDASHWQSVIITGRAERLEKTEDSELAMQLISGRNPTLTPALSKMWIDNWGRANKVAIYRIHPLVISGRHTA
ncbi:MAG: pyridoxamine 5'-phosphate oxidase family protein [Pyrinomonadaceae bacterium]